MWKLRARVIWLYRLWSWSGAYIGSATQYSENSLKGTSRSFNFHVDAESCDENRKALEHYDEAIVQRVMVRRRERATVVNYTLRVLSTSVYNAV